MAFEHVLTTSVQSPSGKLSRSATYSSSSQVEASNTIVTGASGSDRDIYAAIDVSEVVSFWMQSSVNVTVGTNDGSSPDDTFTLTAGVPEIWNSDSYGDFVLTTDVVKPIQFWTYKGNPAAQKVNARFVFSVDDPEPEKLMKQPSPPPPDPKMEALKLKAQLDQQAAANDLQMEQAKMQLAQASEAAKMQLQKAMKAQEMQFKAQEAALKMKIAAMEAGVKLNTQQQEAQSKLVQGNQTHQLGMMQQEEKHQQAMKQEKAKPKAAKPKK